MRKVSYAVPKKFDADGKRARKMEELMEVVAKNRAILYKSTKK